MAYFIIRIGIIYKKEVPACKVFNIVIPIILVYNGLKLVMGKEIGYLSENIFAKIHFSTKYRKNE